MDDSARARWIEAHPYLAGVARLQRAVDDAATADAPAPVGAPAWDRYAADQALGVPLLHSATSGLDPVGPAADLLGRLVDRLAGVDLPPALAAAVRAQGERFRRAPEDRRAAVAWAARGDGEPPGDPGLLRWLGWTAIARAIAPVVGEVARRSEERWTAPVCPTCGAAPVLAQLVDSPQGRLRLLACGVCRTRWRWRRIGCPFCENDAPDRLEGLEVEGEPFRLDLCRACNGYVKTYLGEGDEELFLSDWATLHLDVLAAERGLERKGSSLYAL